MRTFVIAGWLLLSFGAGLRAQQPTVCTDGTFALCTSAPCIPDPRDPEKLAICDCAVERGTSFGMDSCAERGLKRHSTVLATVKSAYAFVQYTTKSTMTCPAGTPWTFCLDKPCTVDPRNPERALCTCDIKTEGEFVTLGGECTIPSCENAYWSGATPSDVEMGQSYLVPALGLSGPPENACIPANKPPAQ